MSLESSDKELTTALERLSITNETTPLIMKKCHNSNTMFLML